MNRALLDSDILSYYFRGDPTVVKNVAKYLDDFDILEISMNTYYEILSGLLAKNAYKQLSIFEEFIHENIVHPVTKDSVRISAEIYSGLKKSGNLIDDIDLLIAGIGIEHNITLITNNLSHFERVSGLRTENWKKIIEGH